MHKLKIVIGIFLLWLLILASYLFFSVYNDIKVHKLLNYTDTYKSSEVEVSVTQQNPTSIKYLFKISSRDDFLGSISFKYFRLKDNPGQVIFRIKEDGASDWYAENRYDFSFFNNDDNYQFGFPEILRSRGKKYILEFEIVTPSLSSKPNFLDLKKIPILTTKYVFPRDTYYRSPSKMSFILYSRIKSVWVEMDKVKAIIYSLAIAIITSLVATHRETHSSQKMKEKSKILKKYRRGIDTLSSNLNFFYIPVGIFVILTIAMVSGNFLLAERMSMYLWIAFILSIVVYIFQVTILKKIEKINQTIRLISTNTISLLDDLITRKGLLVIGILFVLLTGFSKTYYLGGDDSRIFYLYPYEFLDNYSTKIVSDTGLSQLANIIPPSTLSPFIVFVLVLKKLLPFLNLQALLSSANIFGGIISFYYLFCYLLKPLNKHERVSILVCSFMYVFSIFNFYTLFNSRLIAEYLISLFPLSLLLVIRGINEQRLYLIVATVIIWSVFGFFTVTFPLSAAALLTILPLLIFIARKHILRTLLYLLGAAIFFFALNIHWLYFVPYTNFSKQLPGATVKSLTSEEFIVQNEEGIRTVTGINNSFFPLLNSYHKKIQLDFHWPQLPIYLSWYQKYLIVGFPLIGIVIAAGLLIHKDKTRSEIYAVLIICFVLALYFFTVQIGPWGTGIFIWSSNHIPVFVVFRNMYDKFAYSLAFQWAAVLSVSSIVFFKWMSSEKHRSYLLFAMIVITLLNAKPFIFNEFENLPYWTTQMSRDGIRGFHPDYLELIEFVKHNPGVGRYLSLPLLTGNSVVVRDSFAKDRYYAGVSPLLLLTDKNDLSGLLSFGNKAKDVFHWLEKKDYGSIGYLLEQYNVEFIIVTNNTPEDLQHSFMFSDGLFDLQTKAFVKELLGEKIRDFGTNYSLYKISPKYKSNKLYITDSPGSFENQGANLSFKKLASHDYDISISDLKTPLSLVFLDPYLDEWELMTVSGQKVGLDNHHLVFGYANLWEIDPSVIKSSLPETDYQIHPDGSMSLNIKLYFRPYDNFLVLNIVSISAYVLGIVYILKAVKFNFGK